MRLGGLAPTRQPFTTMSSRFASINDIPILGSERKYHWVLGRRPDDHPGLSDLDL
jgi:uncharacterized protein